MSVFIICSKFKLAVILYFLLYIQSMQKKNKSEFKNNLKHLKDVSVRYLKHQLNLQGVNCP